MAAALILLHLLNIPSDMPSPKATLLTGPVANLWHASARKAHCQQHELRRQQLIFPTRKTQSPSTNWVCRHIYFTTRSTARSYTFYVRPSSTSCGTSRPLSSYSYWNELTKPPQERLEWIFWADRDTVILDYYPSVASILPESQRSSNRAANQAPSRPIDLLITNDGNGLMAGVFLIRNSPYPEQTAMEILLKEDRYKDHVVYMPQHWINNYRGETAEMFASRDKVDGLEDWMARRGDFMMHFAASVNKSGEITDYAKVGQELFGRLQRHDVLRNITQDRYFAKLRVKSQS
ncbi:galactosyl transferase GMA12/MNN10 family protein [Metarhizium rileyi]|uniref:Galactosyl transferase GMA12/MNN10 family protein n=1 Tax=Metarhizium rileyi (strain RCEF 4871) TaxID=1649241 RepID=A0A166Y2T5_METRR|nr:galactosyl transferase GMA12/MNN10 family protein [Metarhizium rileyi RCEF 4871]